MVKPVYSMPEKFMEDESVPVKWRLYGLINGFWLNGLPVYASNEYFAEKLGCSERQITRACEELEADGLITRNISGYKRLIVQGGMTPDVEGGRRPTSIKVDAPRQPNASSNASNINPAQSAEIIIEEENPRKSSATTKSANEEYEDGLRWAEKRTGRKFVNRVKQYGHLKKAKLNGITVEQLVGRWMELENDPFYVEKGLDWGMVLNSFDRK